MTVAGVYMLAADIGIGTIPGWLTLAGILVVAWVFWKGGGATAIASLEAANRVLETEVHKLRDKQEADQKVIAGLEEQVKALTRRTDFSEQIGPLITWAEKHDAQVNEWTAMHEDRAQERFEATLNVLQLIADRLGPDTKEEPS